MPLRKIQITTTKTTRNLLYSNWINNKIGGWSEPGFEPVTID